MNFPFFRQLSRSREFLDWQKKNPAAFLSHFYCRLDSRFRPLSPWEAGFYSKKNDKITIFIIGKKISLRPEEDIYKKPGMVIEKLELGKISLDFPQALKIFQNIKIRQYPSEILFNGFLILQNFQHQTVWNISFITKSFQILNVKLNAVNQEIVSHKLLSFIERETS